MVGTISGDSWESMTLASPTCIQAWPTVPSRPVRRYTSAAPEARV
jgi:hypothetical protein